jgi:hypothetical protein
MQRHAVSDIYTTDHNRLPSVDCDTFGLTADVSGIKVWVIPLHCTCEYKYAYRYGLTGDRYGVANGDLCWKSLKITEKICTTKIFDKNASSACKITVIDPQTMPESAKIATSWAWVPHSYETGHLIWSSECMDWVRACRNFGHVTGHGANWQNGNFGRPVTVTGGWRINRNCTVLQGLQHPQRPCVPMRRNIPNPTTHIIRMPSIWRT